MEYKTHVNRWTSLSVLSTRTEIFRGTSLRTARRIESRDIREQIDRWRRNGRLNAGGALICKRWNFRERRAFRTRNGSPRKRAEGQASGGQCRGAFPSRECRTRESYSGNSVRLHRPFNVQRAARTAFVSDHLRWERLRGASLARIDLILSTSSPRARFHGDALFSLPRSVIKRNARRTRSRDTRR